MNANYPNTNRPADCDCERDDDGMTAMCAACRAFDFDGDAYRAAAVYSGALAPADDDDVIPFP